MAILPFPTIGPDGAAWEIQVNTYSGLSDIYRSGMWQGSDVYVPGQGWRENKYPEVLASVAEQVRAIEGQIRAAESYCLSRTSLIIPRHAIA